MSETDKETLVKALCERLRSEIGKDYQPLVAADAAHKVINAILEVDEALELDDLDSIDGNLMDELDFDSLDFIDLGYRLEKQTGKKIETPAYEDAYHGDATTYGIMSFVYERMTGKRNLKALERRLKGAVVETLVKNEDDNEALARKIADCVYQEAVKDGDFDSIDDEMPNINSGKVVAAELRKAIENKFGVEIDTKAYYRARKKDSSFKGICRFFYDRIMSKGEQMADNEVSAELGTKKDDLLREGMKYLQREKLDFNPKIGEMAVSNVYEAIVKQTKKDPASIYVHLVSQLSVDSLEIVEMQMTLEEELDVEIDDRKWKAAGVDQSMQSIIDVVYDVLKERYGHLS
ncbi:hypothetical protein KY328_02490 [Candidatus Woesearchaeota archaeon]|nr:hypothetical protein [Candidatus Woesearchaeota archaeon]MBW3021760.1 hypothetical protein [Candidatus Woesearchaeota archaeon]